MPLSLLLRNGALAGGVAGIFAALFMFLVTEPILERAIAVEERAAAAAPEAGHSHGEVAVSRAAQISAALVLAVVVAALLGIVFALVYAKARHRLPGADDQAKAGWLAAFAAFAVTVFPMVVIPGNPPAVGDPDTVNQRTLLYVAAVLVGVLLVGLGFGLAHLARSWAPVDRRAFVAAGVAVGSVLAVWLLPATPDRIPTKGDASLIAGADLIWDFRIASLAQWGITWVGLGIGFGWLTARRAAERTAVAVR